jgi:HEAT repeat protein
MGQIYRRQTLRFQVLIWILCAFFSHAALATKTTKEASITPEIQSIVEKAGKKKDFSAEMKQITSMKEKPIAALTAIFQDGDRLWKERWFAGMALSKFPNEETKQVLIKGSKDTLSIMRSVSVQALAVYDEKDSNKAIADCLNDTSLLVRDSAVKSLGKIKDRNAVEQLGKELFEQRNYYRGEALFEIRENIILALGDIGSMKAVDPLMKVFQSESPKLQNLACNSLEKIVKPEDLQSKKIGTAKCPDYWLSWYQQNKIEAKAASKKN